MGIDIDIHPFIDYDYSGNGSPFANPDSIRPFNAGGLFWWRDPALFKVLGWVHPEESGILCYSDS